MMRVRILVALVVAAFSYVTGCLFLFKPEPVSGAQSPALTWRDDFSAPTLDSRWSWLREDSTHWSLASHAGFLRITTQSGSLVGAGNNQRNILLTPAPGAAYTITTKVTITPTQNFQHAALLVYQDDDDYIQINRSYAFGDQVSFDLELGGVVTGTRVAVSDTTVYLRIARQGQSYTGYYSTTGFDWLEVGRHTAALTSTAVGIGAANSLDTVPEIAADFDFFGLEQASMRLVLPIIMKSYVGVVSTPADIILHNGVILTMEASPSQAQAVAIRAQTIVGVGSDAAILALQGPQTQVIDLHGLTVMPGFVDPHTHLLNMPGSWNVDLEGAQQVALQNGITTLGNAYTTPDLVAALQSLAQAGRLRVRTSLYLIYTTNCGVIVGDWYKAYPPTRNPGEMLRIGGVKVFLDGGSCGGPAYSYDHPVFGYGNLWLTQEQANTAVADLDAGGYQVALHALGDRAVEQALNVIEHVLNGKPNTLRHRIEHNAVVRDDLLPRYSQVHPVSLIFGTWPCVGRGASPPEPYQAWEWRWSDLLAANPDEHFAWHSDAPFFALNPLVHLYGMVTAHGVSSAGVTCDAPAWATARMLTVSQALPLMTIEAAYALDRDREVGSLRPGKLADLIILSANPLVVDPEQIKDIQVWMTMVGGSVQYCASGHEDLCLN